MSVTRRSPAVTPGTVLSMGRTGIAPRPSPGSWAGRAAAVVLASLALLLWGDVDVLPRSATAATAAAPASAAAAPSSGTARAGAAEAPASSTGVRAASLATAPSPGGPGGGLPPAAGPLVAPHLVADPQRRPPATPLTSTAPGAPGSRAPPGPAGT